MTEGRPDARLLGYGDRAVLVELAPEQVLALRAALLAAGTAGLLSVVPAARTVLVEFDSHRSNETAVRALIRRCLAEPADPDSAPARQVEIPVHYAGPDLEAVAEYTGLTEAELIRRHLDAEYTVRFCGFSPGFGYLEGLDPALRVPRLDTPRTAVAPGSVALADEYTAVYPRRSPGGWRLIGHTELSLFDLRRDPPALLSPGTRVRFVRA